MGRSLRDTQVEADSLSAAHGRTASKLPGNHRRNSSWEDFRQCIVVESYVQGDLLGGLNGRRVRELLDQVLSVCR